MHDRRALRAHEVALLVIAKAPRAGRSKTRLCPPLTPVEAAVVAEAALTDTLRAVVRTPARRRILALEGEPGDWLPPAVEVIPQRGRGLDERLAAAFDDVGGPAFLMGMDTPQVTPMLLTQAQTRLMWPEVDAVLGAADDGGWWGIGLKHSDPNVFLGIPMSTARTGDAQRGRLSELGLRVERLPNLRDVDRLDDALAVASEIPRSRFGLAVRAVIGYQDPDGVIAAPEATVDVPARSAAAVLRWEDGTADSVPLDRFLGEPTPEERELLVGLPSPALDIGCGPGRHVVDLASRGCVALGVEPAGSAARLARHRGAAVLERSVFDRLPYEGRWGSALLMDGTIGIGGDPRRLMLRLRSLLRRHGRAVLEVAGPGAPNQPLRARIEAGGRKGPWFPWARVGADRIDRLAEDTGFELSSLHELRGRWFARVVAR